MYRTFEHEAVLKKVLGKSQNASRCSFKPMCANSCVNVYRCNLKFLSLIPSNYALQNVQLTVLPLTSFKFHSVPCTSHAHRDPQVTSSTGKVSLSTTLHKQIIHYEQCKSLIINLKVQDWSSHAIWKSHIYTSIIIKIIITYWTKKHQAALTHKMSQVINSLYVYGNIYYHVQGAATVLKHSLQKELASKMLQIMGNWEDTSTDY